MTKYVSTLLLFVLFISACKQKVVEVDIVIKNGIVYNGVDSIARSVIIAIKADSIFYIGNPKNIKSTIKARKIIDASGLIVSPGFIDPHTHADKDLTELKTSNNLPFLFQGVTTVAVGNDGSSLFPLAQHRALYEKLGIGTNVIMLTGHGTIRKQVLGDVDKKPSKQELEEMKLLVQKEMDAGAIGMSTGLFYKPGSYSNTEEVIELAKVVSKNKGIYDTHLRDESTFSIGLIPAIKEAITIGSEAQLPIHISHIKCLGTDVWNKSNEVINLISRAQSEGLEISANQYPYEASATSLQAAVIPRWAESGGKDSLFIRSEDPEILARILKETKSNIQRRGGPDKLLIVRAKDTTLIGKNLLEISNLYNLTPSETVLKILKLDAIKVASFNMNFNDIVNFMQQDWVVTGSDGGSGHPRKYGSFPRKYRKFVVEDSIIPLHTFINNSSSKTAEIFKLLRRGSLKKGNIADIIIFDPKTFSDKADYTNAFEYSKGLHYAIINGRLSIENGIFNERKNGKVVTHGNNK